MTLPGLMIRAAGAAIFSAMLMTAALAQAKDDLARGLADLGALGEQIPL